MESHQRADHNFYVTANVVLKLAAQVRKLFESSEVEEKRQLLRLVFQNLELSDVTLSIQVHNPFSTDDELQTLYKELGMVGLEPTKTEVR